ncbi:hypothetical protein NDU88_001405 [Pleurodeles waltl]|uniref:Uncharacterized protein n=1 Tax=Pleurodeles waltl TaxID=8319 RepID=A0AAV7WP86_PLEWA|nr:hypothetical protein NDU88_001405 [Pleurodeles waltl]
MAIPRGPVVPRHAIGDLQPDGSCCHPQLSRRDRDSAREVWPCPANTPGDVADVLAYSGTQMRQMQD